MTVGSVCKRIAMIFAALAAVLVVSAYGTLPAAASSNAEVSLSIPVEYEISRGIKADTRIILTGSGGAPMPEGSEDGVCELQFEGSGRDEFGPITYSRPDVYEYRVTKETADIDGMTKDKSVYIVRVQVTNDGKSVIVIQKDGEEEKYEAVRYADAVIGDVYDDPPVKKTVSGDRPPSGDTFSFVMKAERVEDIDGSGRSLMPASEMPMPEGSNGSKKILKLKAGEEGEFGFLHFTQPGVYHYTISEADTKEQGYKYDDRVYHVQYTVTENNGKWKSVRVISDKDGNEVNIALFEFVNEYKKPAGGILHTGDKNNIKIYALIMFTALAVLTVMLTADKCRRKHDGKKDVTETRA